MVANKRTNKKLKKQPVSKRFVSRMRIHSRSLLAITIVFAICGLGYFGYINSSADSFNASYQIKVSSKLGCKLAGRSWDDQANKGAGDCKSTCRYDKAQLLHTTHKPSRSYCQGYVNTNMEPDQCIVNLHRYFIDEVGCARRPSQENINEAPQCIPNYPNYVADATTDRCIPQKIAGASSGSGAGQVGTGAPITSPTNTSPTPGTPPDAPTQEAPPTSNTAQSCRLLGRKWDNAAGICKNSCQAGAGVLLVGVNSGVKYCQLSIAVTANGSQKRCEEALHRVWLVEGCARRFDQKDATRSNTEPLIQCQSGFDYYNANFNNKLEDNQTLTDVCEKSKSVAVANEQGGAPGDTTTPPATVPEDDDGQPTNPDDTPIPLPDDPGTTGQPVKQKLDYDLNKVACNVRGRSYIVLAHPSAHEPKGGCSRQECLNKAAQVLKTADGGHYCPGYVNRNITAETCQKLHRKWLNDIPGCALRPAGNNHHPVVNAQQCQTEYPVYIYHKSDVGSDECLQKSVFQYLQGVAQGVGKPVSLVASWTKARVCKVQGLVLRDGSCKKDVTTANPSDAKGGTIKAMQFNVHVTSSDGQYYADMNRLLANNPDVVTLNEAYRLTAAQLSLRGYDYFRSHKNRDQLETPVLWRADKWRPIATGTILVSNSGLKNATRFANWATLENRNRPAQIFTIVSAHTIPVPLAAPVRSQVLNESVKNLNDLIEKRKQDGPVIVGGDFNIDYQADLRSNKPGFPHQGFKKTNTYSTFELLGAPENGWGTGEGNSNADLDYLFMTKNMGLKAERHFVVRGLNSDHSALIANFSFGN